MCGLVGVYAFQADAKVKELSAALLLRLQHRGQDGAGLVTLNEDKLEGVRGLGLINQALGDLPRLSDGRAAIAHTRYATTGTGSIAEIQPFVEGSPRLAMAHNGNIANAESLSLELKIETCRSDLDLIQQIFLRRYLKSGFSAAVSECFARLNGAYAVIGLFENGDFFAFRDPHGIRPLFWTVVDKMCFVASESAALPGHDVQEVPPAGFVWIQDGVLKSGVIESFAKRESFCMFEAVYFSSPQSEWKGRSVYRMRFRLGEALAAEIKAALPSPATEHFDFVVPVPETSRAAATAVAEKLGLPYREFLVKNPYIPRTFILAGQDARLKALSQKLSLIGPEIDGKRILLVDDSVVRGNTSKMMASRLREAGASSVALASSCPPIRDVCVYGIDFPDPDELVAHARSESEIAKLLQCDQLFYLSLEGLYAALATENLCTGCLTGKHPTRDASFAAFLNARKMDRRVQLT